MGVGEMERFQTAGRIAVVCTSVVALLAGCATIINGKTQSISIQSVPSGATVSLNGAPLGATPLTQLIERKAGQTLTVSKEGHKTFTTQMSTSLEPWFWGNIVIGGVIGSTTDNYTGAMYQYAPSQYLVTLEPDGGNKITTPGEKSKKDRIREFVMLNYNQLVSDLSKGAGSFQSSLMKLLEVAKNEEAAASKRIKAMADAFPDIGQFADNVANAFTK
jgi:hypothetical protein